MEERIFESSPTSRMKLDSIFQNIHHNHIYIMKNSKQPKQIRVGLCK